MSGNLKNKVSFLTLLLPIILLSIFPLMTCESDENPRVKWPCEEDSLVECGGDYYKTPIPICSCKLSREITYNGITLPKGSLIGKPDEKDTNIYFDNENDWVDHLIYVK